MAQAPVVRPHSFSAESNRARVLRGLSSSASTAMSSRREQRAEAPHGAEDEPARQQGEHDGPERPVVALDEHLGRGQALVEALRAAVDALELRGALGADDVAALDANADAAA